MKKLPKKPKRDRSEAERWRRFIWKDSDIEMVEGRNMKHQKPTLPAGLPKKSAPLTNVLNWLQTPTHDRP